MWYACSISTGSWYGDLPDRKAIDFSNGVKLEPVPEWIKNEEALGALSWRDKERVLDAVLAFSVEYDAAAIGSPDPDWTGRRPMPIQSSVEEKLMLASAALWLVKPCGLSCGLVMHYSENGNPDSLRQINQLRSVRIADDQHKAIPTLQDFDAARHLFGKMLEVNRDCTIWIAVRLLVRAITESMWEARYVWFWVVLEALFGPNNPGETTYRLTQRISLFLGNSTEQRSNLFREARSAYTLRSKIVHGRNLSRITTDKMEEHFETTEKLTRLALCKILISDDHVSEFNSKGRDDYLDTLAFL